MTSAPAFLPPAFGPALAAGSRCAVETLRACYICDLPPEFAGDGYVRTCRACGLPFLGASVRTICKQCAAP